MSKEAKVKSLKEAMVILEDITEYLTCENLSKMANDLSKVLSNIQSTWLSRKLKASVQRKVRLFSNESTVMQVSIQYSVQKLKAFALRLRLMIVRFL